MLEKILSNKKSTQFKTSRILKIYEFEILDNKNTRKLSSKFELLFLDQINSSSDSSQVFILRVAVPRASLPPSPSLSNFGSAN